MNQNVLSSLIHRRAEMAKEAKALNAALEGILRDVEHIDGAIRTYDPAYRPRRVIVQRATRTDIMRTALSVMRKATEPMLVRDIAVAVIAERGGNVKDRKVVNEAVTRTRAVMVRQQKAGVVKASQGPGLRVLWEVTR